MREHGDNEPIDTPDELLLDGLDNDNDGLTDCADPDCVSMLPCVAMSKEAMPMYGVPFERTHNVDDWVGVPCRPETSEPR